MVVLQVLTGLLSPGPKSGECAWNNKSLFRYTAMLLFSILHTLKVKLKQIDVELL